MPGYDIPSYERLRDTLIPERYQELREEITRLIDTSYSCSIILDIWSSPSMKSYLGVSCSFVTETFVPFTCFLTLKEMPKHHTAAAIFAEYEAIMEEWKISKKVSETSVKQYVPTCRTFPLHYVGFNWVGVLRFFHLNIRWFGA